MGFNGSLCAGHRIPMDTGLRRYDRGQEAVAGARYLKAGTIMVSARLNRTPFRSDRRQTIGVESNAQISKVTPWASGRAVP